MVGSKNQKEGLSGVAGWGILYPTLFQKREKDGAPASSLVEAKRPTQAKIGLLWALAFKSASHAGRALTVREIGALSHLDNITIRIADVTARLAVLGDRLGDELGSSTFP